jgi:hypothetical protein
MNWTVDQIERELLSEAIGSIAFPDSEVVEAVIRAQGMLGNDWMEAETRNEKGFAPAMRIIGMGRQSYHRSSTQPRHHCSTTAAAGSGQVTLT